MFNVQKEARKTSQTVICVAKSIVVLIMESHCVISVASIVFSGQLLDL